MFLPNEVFELLGEINYDRFALSVVRLKERQELSEIRGLQEKFNNDDKKSEMSGSVAKSKHEDRSRKVFENTAKENIKAHVATNQSLSSLECSSAVKTEKPLPKQSNEVFANESDTPQVEQNQRNTKDFEDKRRSQEEEDTRVYIQNIMASKEAMQCPKCGILVMKDDGCSFVTCAACELEICFLTQKPRHGTVLSDGQFIDGCHCMENGVRCHPKCTNCH